MKNIRISEQYVFLFLGCKPKKKFGTEDQAVDRLGTPLFTLEVLLVDCFRREKPQPISVTIPHEIEEYEIGEGIQFHEIAVTMYTLESGKSGLSWRALKAGSYEDLKYGED